MIAEHGTGLPIRVALASSACALLLACAPAALGCAQDEPPRQQEMNVTEAPEPPPRRDIPIDAQMAAEARQIVGDMTHDKDPLRRANALEAAEHLPRQTALALLEKGLEDEDPRVRFVAAMAAGRLQLKELKPKVEVMAEGQSPNGRVAAVFALHRLGDTSRSQLLVEYSQSPDPLVRANTAVALGLLGEPSAVRVLSPMRDDPEPNVRFNVSEALWRLKQEEGFESLLGASISGFSDDRVLGTLALAAAGDRKAEPALHGKLTDEYVEVQLAAARGLGMLGSDRGYAVAAGRVAEKDPRRRAMAALALGEIGRTDAQAHIRPLMKDADPYVRLAAATATLMIAEEAEAQTAGAGAGPRAK